MFRGEPRVAGGAGHHYRRTLSKTQYQYTLVDVDSDELDHWAPILLQKLQTLPRLTDVASDQQTDGRVMKIEVNRQVASQLGINLSVVDSILYDAFGQRVAARIYTRLNQYFVILEVEPGFQLGPNALSRIYATSASGTQVPLSQFATVTSTVAPIAVNHHAAGKPFQRKKIPGGIRDSVKRVARAKDL